MIEFLSVLSLIISIFSAVYFIPLIIEYVNRPRFAWGLLPFEENEIHTELAIKKGERINFKKWTAGEHLKTSSESGQVKLVLIVANVGKTDIDDGMVFIEIWNRNVIINDIFLEYLKPKVAFGPRENIVAPKFSDCLVDDEIIEFYDSIGMKGIFLQLEGNMPANTYEVVIISAKIASNEAFSIKTHVRTRAIKYQQKPLIQCIEIEPK